VLHAPCLCCVCLSCLSIEGERDSQEKRWGICCRGRLQSTEPGKWEQNIWTKRGYVLGINKPAWVYRVRDFLRKATSCGLFRSPISSSWPETTSCPLVPDRSKNDGKSLGPVLCVGRSPLVIQSDYVTISVGCVNFVSLDDNPSGGEKSTTPHTCTHTRTPQFYHVALSCRIWSWRTCSSPRRSRS
jgi:hypothetical protein